MNLKATFKKIYVRLVKLSCMNDHAKYARRLGVTIGKQAHIMRECNWGSEPYLITIGEHVMISSFCSFINHDGCVNTVKGITGEKDVWKYGRITIGNNVSIGAHSIILPGVTIGENAVIGAGSVVTKSVPAGEVWAGNPAHFIKTTDEYTKKIITGLQQFDMQNYRKNKQAELTEKVR